MMKKYFFLASCLFISIFSHAQSFVAGGINYTITDAVNFYVEVADNQSVTGAVVISASVVYSTQAYSVTAIKNDAFLFSGITSVNIPNSVLSIGNYAFSNIV